MSYNADDASPSTPGGARDWIFPSYSFAHSTHSHHQRSSRRRKISTYPTQFNSAAASFPSRPATDDSTPVLSCYPSKFSGFRRRRFEFGRNYEKSTVAVDDTSYRGGVAEVNPKDEVSRETKTTFPEKNFFGFIRGRLGVRWQIAFTAILISVLSLLVQKNFSLHNEINHLQDQISKLNGRLKLCNHLDPLDNIMSKHNFSVDSLPSKSIKIVALAFSIILLSFPLLFFKCVNYVSNSRKSLDNNTEEVSLNKQLAYRVDAFLSATPYAKPLALLVATLLLICLGGLALFGVTNDNLADSLWLSWTYVADSGNHVNSDGIGPRLASVSISFGGMLIFAMMLALVSDAISEKFDSLTQERKK